jgi:hypothetical protein
MPGHRVSERPQARSWRPAPRDHHRMVRLFVNASAAALVFGPLFFRGVRCDGEPLAALSVYAPGRQSR